MCIYKVTILNITTYDIDKSRSPDSNIRKTKEHYLNVHYTILIYFDYDETLSTVYDSRLMDASTRN